MSRHIFRIVQLCTLLSVFIGCNDTPSLSTVKPDVSFTLLSLDPTVYFDGEPKPPGEMFHGHAVLGQLVVASVETQTEIMDALQVGFDESDGVAKCFWPRHGIRIVRNGVAEEYVICFECFQVMVYRDGNSERKLTSQSPRPVFDRVLTNANIKIAD